MCVKKQHKTIRLLIEWLNPATNLTQPAFTYSNSTMETAEQSVKSAPS